MRHMKHILDGVQMFLSGMALRELFLFACAFFLTYLLTPAMRLAAARLNIMDLPDERKIHKKPTPKLGGLAIYMAYVLVIFFNFDFSIELKGVIIGGTIILLVGLMDDIRSLRASWKLAGQIFASSALVLSGVKFNFLPEVWWGHAGEIVLTFIWVVGITNAVNFFDGMDGLAAGLTAICSLSFFIVAEVTGQSYLGYITVVLAGSCLGFLRFNFKPASIFLGDAGSTFLGFTLAGVAIMGGWAENNPKVALTLPILILSIFIFDMTYITITRILRKRVTSFREWIEYTGKDHLHHRLVLLGFTEIQTVLLVYLMALCLGLGGINLRVTNDLKIYVELLQGFCVLMIIVILMLAGRELNKK